MPFYAVARGKKPGVYGTWAECSEQVGAFKGARYKKFDVASDAQQFLVDNGGVVVATPLAELVTAKKELESLKLSLRSFAEAAEEKFSSLGTKIESAIKLVSSPKDQNPEDDHVTPSKKRKLEVSSPSSSLALAVVSSDEIERIRDCGFIIDAEGFVQAFTDGACEGNGHKTAKAGVGVWFNHNHRRNVSIPVSAGGRATNNCAEIEAGIEAVRAAKDSGIARLCINTDSQFMIDCMTKWIVGWKRKGWKTAVNADVKNKDELIRLDKMITSEPKIEIKWNHVKGHAGIVGNEEADRLARMGAKEYVPGLGAA